MAGMSSTLRETLIGLPIYKPLRFVYQSVFDKEAVLRRRSRRQFYSSFIREADLVFDVGANLGNYAEAFLEVGATVVAIEPDPRNVKILRKRLHKAVCIEECALGRNEGTAQLRIADRDDVSTLSEDWARKAQAHWQGTVPVQVCTLDSLARRHGIPKYVKVDAEGYDAEVLRGMSFAPPMVSFEFQPVDMGIAQECIKLLRGRSFNFVIEERAQFELDHWVNAGEMLAVLARCCNSVAYGDVFAKSDSVFPAKSSHNACH